MQTLTSARRATTPSDSKVEQSWVPAPTEFSTTGSAVAPSRSAACSLARSRPSTSRSIPSASQSPPWLPACTTTRSTPRAPAAASSRARASTERSRCSSFVEARFMRYFACATTGEMPRVRLPSTKAAVSCRRLGSAQACGLETKTWIVSHPSSRAASRVLASPPEVGRCRPMLFVLPGMARILAARRGLRCERYNLSKLSKRSEGATGMAVAGKVAKVLGNNEIVINRGRGQGVRQGMLFEIFAPEGEEVWDPDTGETLGTVEDVKAKAEVTEVKERLAVARIQNAQETPFGAVDIGEMQENLQRMFGQMFGDDVQVRGFGTNQGGDDPDLESMLGSPLQDLSKVQVGDAVREIPRR